MRPFIRRLFIYWRPGKQYHPRGQSPGQPYWYPGRMTRQNMSSSTSAILYALTVSATSPEPTVPGDAAAKSHHTKSGFTNPWESWHRHGPLDFIKAVISREITGEAHHPDTTPPTVPVHKPNFLPSREGSSLRVTWLGHACFYVEFPSGLRVLFDPVFEDRCSPFSWLGPKRYTSQPCQISEIPIIDVVVISHNHYDHLSLPTVTEIAKRHPNCHFFVPLGNEKWFHDSGIKKVTEMDWWEQRDLTLSPQTQHTETTAVGPDSKTEPSNADIVARISCTPSQHMSARSPFDALKTLWASWSVESGGRKVFFAGDTGYRAVPKLKGVTDDHAPEYKFPICPAFKEIGEFRGPFDVGLIPIGAYEPRYFMSPVHADPHDAVNIFQDTQCKRALGMHWGTWVLTEEDVMEPPKKLKEALKRNELPETGTFDVCDIGESREF